MNATGSYSSVEIEDSVTRIRAVTVGFPLPLRSRHPVMLTKTSYNPTVLSA